MREENKQSNAGVYLDGGWGWTVMMVSFLSQTLIGSVYFGYGILLPEWMNEFKSSSAITSLVGSTVAGVISGSGPIASWVILKSDCRTTHVVGGAIIAISTMLCCFADNMIQIFILYSIVAGIGGSLCYVSSVITLSEYFKHKRSIAVGIAASGIGFGSFLFPVFYQYLIEHYGWRGVMLIAGAINANMIPFGMIMCPVKKAPVIFSCMDANTDIELSDHNNNSSLEKSDNTEQKTNTQRKSSFQMMRVWIRNPLARRKSSTALNEKRHEVDEKHDILEVIPEDEEDMNQSHTKIEVAGKTNKSYTRQLFKLIKEPFFYILIFHNVTMFFGMMIAFGLTPLRAVYDNNMTQKQGAILVSITGFTNLFGRFVWGLIASSKNVNTTTLFLSLRIIAGVLTLASPLAKSFFMNAIYCALAGMSFGNWSIYPVVVGDHFGDHLMTVAFGYLETANGIGGILGPLVGGYLYDITHSYQYSFVASGSSLLIGVLPFVLHLAMRKFVARNETIFSNELL